MPPRIPICEVFCRDEPEGKSARSFHPIIERLCATSYAAKALVQFVFDPVDPPLLLGITKEMRVDRQRNRVRT